MNLGDKEKARETVREGLLRFGNTLPKGGTFAGNPEADKLLRTDPFAFLMAASTDRGARVESVWELSWHLCHRLGELNAEQFSRMTPVQLEEILRQLPKKPRFPNQAERTIVSLAKLVSQEFKGDAGRIWDKNPALQVLDSLQRIYGVGPGIAHMTIRILIDEGQYQPCSDDLRLIDIKPDVHVIRVFYRSGLSNGREGQSCIEAARRLHPEFPGKLDWPAWEIGRKYCHEGVPNCLNCPLDDNCPKAGI
jgi:endonuclease-3